MTRRVAQLMEQGRVVGFLARERPLIGQVDRVGRWPVVGAVAAGVGHARAVFVALDDRLGRHQGRDPFALRREFLGQLQALDLGRVEHGVDAQERDSLLFVLARVGVLFRDLDLAVEHRRPGLLALHDVGAAELGLVEREPHRRAVAGRAEDDPIDPAVEMAGDRERALTSGEVRRPWPLPGDRALVQKGDDLVGHPLIGVASGKLLGGVLSWLRHGRTLSVRAPFGFADCGSDGAL
jgi:hypothetical protein